VITVKSLLAIFLIALVIGGFSLAGVMSFALAQSESSFKISGYILDPNGHGLSGAEIIFNLPSIVPSVYSDSSGHYEISAPAGTYHINVWPPFDSNFIYYDQTGFVVESDLTKNITLALGCKVSGYIFDSSGKPVPKAIVSLNNYLCGWYSISSGYYFVTAPAGTYTLSARPGNGPKDAPNFPTYYEYNFVVNGNLAKNITVESTASSFKISGYVLDSDGHGIGGANIIFNVPSIVPSVYSDSSGHYVISAPAGTYHVNVWPPFDSVYINYDEPGLVVGSDIAKNMTLNSGYKVSGYISDSSGTPVTGAAVLLGNSVNTFGSGWFSNYMGYYFLNVPAGIYTIDAHPRTGNFYSGPTTNFPTYYEYNFTVNGNTVKNITVGGSSPTTSPSPTPSPSPTSPAKASPTQITISADTSSPIVGSVVNVNGGLSYVNGTSLPGKLVTLSYAFGGNSTWVPIGSAITNEDGEYNIQWVNVATGIFKLKVEWTENAGYPETSNTTTLSFLPYNDQTVFFVESNSTVSTLAFFSTSSELSFAVSGPENTTGYVKATIAKSLVSNAADTKVYVDGNLLGYILTETANSWVLTFNYHHSTHQVRIALETDETLDPAILGPKYLVSVAVAAIGIVAVTSFTAWQIKKKQDPVRSA